MRKRSSRRLAIDRLRVGGREELTGEEVDSGDADESLVQLEEAMIVREALATLPDHCREVLDRFFTRDESYDTIGEALDIPAGTIASRISRCLGKLRARLEGRSDAPSPSGDQVTA